MQADTLREIWAAYGSAMGASWHAWVGLAAGAGWLLAVSELAKRSWFTQRTPKFASRLELSLLAMAAIGGLYLVVTRASVFDDAFISFRYARNLLEGNGLVWNVDERVEGYTNFLWTLLVAGASFLSGIELPRVGLWMSIAVFPANIWLIYRLGRLLAAPLGASFIVPAAAILTALQDVFVTAGSTGLETGFAVLLVNAGLLRLMTARSHSAVALSGCLLILAALAHPDHALFYAAGAAVLLQEHVLRLRQLGRSALPEALRCALAFAAPFLLYLAHVAWRLSYYGEWLPNTFYAKSGDLSWYSQGAAYALTFYLGSNFWLLLPLVVMWLLRGSQDVATRRFKWFTGVGLLAYNLYVIKVGGDFMYGRLYAVVVPLILLSACQAAWELLRGQGRLARVSGVASALTLAASVGGVTLLQPRDIKWGIADERTFYPVVSWDPLVIDHPLFRLGKRFERMAQAGLQFRIGSGAIGMIGFYSGFEVLDLLGLTDAHVARQPLRRRGRPGHEKWADPAYVAERRPHLVRSDRYTPQAFRKQTRFSFGPEAPRPWFIYHYDQAVMEQIAAIDPELKFMRPEAFWDDAWERVLPSLPGAKRDAAEKFLRRYYQPADGTRPLH